MKDDQRKAMFAKMGKGSSGLKSTQLHPLLETKKNPDKKIVSIVNNELKNQDQSLLTNIDSVIVEKTENPVKPNAVALYDSSKKEIKIIDKKGRSNDSIKYDLKHEIEHSWFDKEKKLHPKKVEEYRKSIEKLKPSTVNLEIYHNQLNVMKNFRNEYKNILSKNENKTLDEIISYLGDEYVDEFHSETGELMEYQKDGIKEPYFIADDSYKQAITAYNKLHE